MIGRRSFLTHTAVGGGAAALGFASGRRGLDQEVASARFHGDDVLGQGRAAGVWHRYKFIGQPVMDAQIVFWLGLASMGLTDVGEVLDTAMGLTDVGEVLDRATRVRPGDESQVHCQGGNQLLAQARLFDWLDERVAR
ncbi:twin-arginine translocation signal domain-containing protein [Sorangium cellulosum]|uniref:Uncharacterized protein n=1 Tax=Sorangium cellulosum TaxID=56 RepID=A0A150Q3K0_SORCE|nr:twin-arginine translocation signal domain-containing protein [Sorangium cellulosum]KYF62581.1 hypothetical protein BE15_42360 [Sorangium cellulosum]